MGSIRQALLHKKNKAIGTILVIDAAQVGAIVGPALVKTYHRTYDDPTERVLSSRSLDCGSDRTIYNSAATGLKYIASRTALEPLSILIANKRVISMREPSALLFGTGFWVESPPKSPPSC